MRGDLTTLDAVKAWLAPGQGTLATTNDSLLESLITRGSRLILSILDREIAVADYNEWYDSGGRDFLNLRQWPVRTMTEIQFGGVSITQAATGNPPLNGWMITDPSRLMVRGWLFPRGRNVVNVQYQAGYFINDECHTIVVGETPPAAAPITTDFMWLGDLGVTIDGVAAVLVDDAPAAGQYAVSDAGDYTFAVADIGKRACISYSYCPPDLEQAVIELIGEMYKHRDRIGMQSKSLPNGETVSFLVKSISDRARLSLEAYIRRAP